MAINETRPATLAMVEHAMIVQELQNPKIREDFIAKMGNVRKDIADFVTNLPKTDLKDEATVNRIRRYNAILRPLASDRIDTDAQCRVFDLERSDLDKIFTTRSTAWETIAGKDFNLKTAALSIAGKTVPTTTGDSNLDAEIVKLLLNVGVASVSTQVPPPVVHKLADQADTDNWTFASGDAKVIADLINDLADVKPFETRTAFAILRR